MEISERALRRMVSDVDDAHRQGLETMAEDIAELHSGEGKRLMGSSRRRFMRGLGAGGVTLAIGGASLPLSSLWSSAHGQAGSDQTVSDQGLAKFAESLELAAVATYQLVAMTGKLTTPAVLSAAKTFASHHQAHAAAFGQFGGDTQQSRPNPRLVEAIAPKVMDPAATQTSLVTIAFGLENSAAATYLFAIGALQSPQALRVTASILPVECQHAVVLGSVLGMPVGNDQGPFMPAFLDANAKVDPNQYPIAPGT